MVNVLTKGDPRKAAKPTTTANEFLAWWFRRGDRIAFASYANDRDQAKQYPPREKVTTNPADVAAFIDAYDTAGRACYFGVNPVRKNRRGKDHIASIVGLHADIDFSGVVESRKAIRAAIAKLKFKPTAVVASGHGLHLYYKFTKSLPPEQIPSHEDRLRRFCEMLAADKSAAEVARVLRLPGSHNTKSGGWLEVCIIEELSSWTNYKVDNLDAWIEDTTPVLTYKPMARVVKSNVVALPLNPFQALACDTRELTSKLDIDEVLDAMQFHGVHRNGIDDTYTRVVGAMVASGATIDECLDVLLEPTRLVYERDRRRGEGAWNERRAIRDIGSKHRYFRRKDARNANG